MQKSLLKERPGKCKGTESEHIQDVTHSPMRLISVAADLLVLVVLIFIQRLKDAFGKITGLES